MEAGPAAGEVFFEGGEVFSESCKEISYIARRRAAQVASMRLGHFAPSSSLQRGNGDMRSDQDAAQVERVSLAYRRLANAMILSTLREISKADDIAVEAPEVDFVESPRIDPWCELAGLEVEVVRRAARRLLGTRVITA